MRISKLNRLLRVSLLMGGIVMAGMANSESTNTYVQGAEQVGKARMTFLFWDVYDATLYAPEGNWSADSPFVLELEYLRDLDGEAIAKRSAEEMRKQGFDDEVTLARWHELMSNIFPDVSEGVRITGVADEQQHTHFYLNDQPIGSIAEPDFTRRFFDIWLSDKTSEPGMRKKLLGVKS